MKKTASDLRDDLGLGSGPMTPEQRDELIREIARAMVKTMEVDDLKANALGRLVDAEGTPSDVLRAHNKLTGAVVMATLSEVDAIQELTATLKGIANTLIDVIEVVSPVRSTKEEAMEQEQTGMAPAEPDESITAEAPEEPQAEPESTESESTSSPDEPAAEPDAPADPEPSDPEPSDPEPESEDAGGGEPATEE